MRIQVMHDCEKSILYITCAPTDYVLAHHVNIMLNYSVFGVSVNIIVLIHFSKRNGIKIELTYLDLVVGLLY